MTQQIFRKLRLLSIAQGEPTNSQAVQTPKEEKQVHTKPMTRQCAEDKRARPCHGMGAHARKGGRQTDRRARQMGAHAESKHGARGEGPGTSRSFQKTRERPRRLTKARARQTAPKASRQCLERSGIFQIVFADLVRRFMACKSVVYFYKYPKGVHLYRQHRILGNSSTKLS